jgi:hypothetical protein
MIEVGDPVVITKSCCTPEYVGKGGTVRKMLKDINPSPFTYWYCDGCGLKFPKGQVMCLLFNTPDGLWPVEWLRKLTPPKVELKQQEETHA